MPSPKLRTSALRERLAIQRNDPPTLSVSSLTRVNTTATATTAVAHGYTTGDYVTHAGADQAAYNVKAKVTVTGTTTYTFTVAGAPTTPATGTVTAVYTSNAQGGQGANFWRTLDTIPAEMIPLRAWERLQRQAIQSSVEYRFRVRVRADLEPTMRVLWTPSWVKGEARKTLVLTGPPIPVEDGRQYMYLECSEVAA